MDYKYVAGAEALLLSSQRRRASTFKLSLLAGTVLLTGLCIAHFQAKKAPEAATDNHLSTPMRAEIITGAVSPTAPILGSIGLPIGTPLVMLSANAETPLIPTPPTVPPSSATITPPAAATPNVPGTPPAEAAATTSANPAKLVATDPTQVLPEWKTVTIRKGDTLGKIFNRLGLKTELAKPNSGLKKATKQLTQLKAASQLKILIDTERNIKELNYALNDIETIKVTRKGTGYHSEILRQKTTTQLANRGGIVSHSLMRMAQKQGLDKKQIVQLATIFKDKININALRHGDHVNVLVQEEYIGNKKVRTGPIMAAQITTRGNTLSAVRYVDANGRVEYFTPDGKSLRRGFTRVPLAHYTYVSSPFSQSRLHPISGQFKRHPAVDFAAPSGTPIKAAGAGKVLFVGSKGAYGKTVIIEHHNDISTLYAHMNAFDPAIRRGTQVQEGQTIGSVGSTGMSTGPHLHYELRVAGIHRNPMTVNLPSAAPLSKAARAKFIPQARHLLAQMDTPTRTKLVSKATTAKRKSKNS